MENGKANEQKASLLMGWGAGDHDFLLNAVKAKVDF